MVNWTKSHAFLMGALGACLKYTGNIENAKEYFKALENWFADEDIAKAIFDVEVNKMVEKKEPCWFCGDGDPEKVGHKTKVADEGFTCKVCGATYV